MADISKRGGSDDCEGEGGERGERGERGKRGHRGHRGHRGPEGPPGPAGVASNLVGPTTGDAALVAAEDIPIASVIAPGGSALRAIGRKGGQASKEPRNNAIGVATASASTGQIVDYVAAGPLTLDEAVWDSVTDGSGGLVPGTSYYLSQDIPGHMTSIAPTSGQIMQVGVAFSPRTLDVKIDAEPLTFTTGNGGWGLKWSGRLEVGTAGLADAGTGTVSPPVGNRYPLCSNHTAICYAIRTQSNTLSPGNVGVVSLLKNGVAFASSPAPTAVGGKLVISIPPQAFDPGDDIEVQLQIVAVSPVGPGAAIGVDVVVEFEGIQGPTGAEGPTGPAGAGATGPAGPQGPTGPAATPLPWLPINKVTNPVLNGSFPVLAGFFNAVDASVSFAGKAALPAASSVPNGTPIAIGNYPGLDGGSQVPIDLELQPGDSVNGQTLSPTTAYQLNNPSAWLLLVSDGVSNWQPLSYASLFIP